MSVEFDIAMQLKTRVFELSKGKYKSIKELARAMGVPRQNIYRVRKGEYPVNQTFIVGALKALPGYKLDDLFYVVPDGSGVTDRRDDLRAKGNLVSAQQPSVRRSEVVKLRNAGLTYSEIGSKLGITKQRAWGIINEKPEQKPAPDSNNGMLTAREIARFLNVHINTVRRWSNKGTLKTYRIGNRGDRRFRREDVVAFLKG